MSVLRRVGLQGWLVAALLGVGMLASLAVLLVVLPTLESSVRQDRARAEQARLQNQLGRVRPQTELPIGADRADLEASALQVRSQTGGEVRIVYRPTTFARPRSITIPAEAELFEQYGDQAPRLNRVAVSSDRSAVLATTPLFVGGQQVGVVETIVPVVGANAAIATVQRRVFIAVILVLALAALAGYGLARLIGRRIAGLAGTAATLAGGDLTARAHELPPRELATLGASLNGMAGRLEGLVDELTSERDRARGLIASLAEGVVAVSSEGEVVVANAAAERYLGIEPGPARLDALPPEVVDAVLAARGGAEDDSPRAVRGPDDHELELHVRRLGSEGEGGLVLTLRDVTEERQLDRARRDLVANVSHELKTPVAALRGFLELLEDDEVDPATRQEFLSSMSQETMRLQRLVEEQLQLARLDSGALPLDREPVDLGDLAADVVGSRAALAERDGVQLALRLPGAARVVVRADAARIEQVVLILIDNALRHTPHGGRVQVVVSGDPQTATLSVADTGEGIPIEEQDFVFDRFYRGDASREGRSAGLGLAIARGIVDAHGGSVRLRSRPGAGTTVSFDLPRATGQEPTGVSGSSDASDSANA